MNRSFLFLSLSTLIAACGTAPASVDVSSDDLTGVVSANGDLDGNGNDDSLQSFVVARTSEFGAVLLVKPGSQLPGGIADGQDLSLFGYGNEQYSSSDNGWVDGFFQMAPVYLDGSLAWYGAGGLRDGNYEVTCGTSDSTIGSLDGWCLPGEQETEYDVHELLMTVKDGQEGCWREVTRWAFEVQSDWIDPLTTRLSDPDENCYEE